jgi:hypothetical protein
MQGDSAVGFGKKEGIALMLNDPRIGGSVMGLTNNPRFVAARAEAVGSNWTVMGIARRQSNSCG